MRKFLIAAFALAGCVDSAAPAPIDFAAREDRITHCIRTYVEGQMAKLTPSERASNSELESIADSAANWCVVPEWRAEMTGPKSPYEINGLITEMQLEEGQQSRWAFSVALDLQHAYECAGRGC